MSLRWTWKLVLAAAALGAATAAANRPPVEELPSGWKAVEDKAGGGTYFWNQKSGEVTWDRPFHLDFADLDDVDDLLTGTGIERYDLRVMGVDGASAYLPDISETGQTDQNIKKFSKHGVKELKRVGILESDAIG